MPSYVRDIFTGELVEREYQEPGIIARTTVPDSLVDGKCTRSPWYKERVNRNMSIKPEEATPERIEKENADAKRHGTGAVYAPDGTCYLGGRVSRAREMRRRGFQDNDSGYSDYAGR